MCNAANSYLARCVAKGPNCNPCISNNVSFHTIPRDVAAIQLKNQVDNMTAGSPSDVTSCCESTLLQLTLSDQGASFFGLDQPIELNLVDKYGNVVLCSDGPITVSLLSHANPRIANLEFCFVNQPESECITGVLNVTTRLGVALFSYIYLPFPGPDFVLKFQYKSLSVSTTMFDVLPHPPRVTAVYFDELSSAITIMFDAVVRVKALASSMTCDHFFTWETMRILGDSPSCSWIDHSILQVYLGGQSVFQAGSSLCLDMLVQSSVTWMQYDDGRGVMMHVMSRLVDSFPSSSSDAVKVLESNSINMSSCLRANKRAPAISQSSIDVSQTWSAVDMDHFNAGDIVYFLVAYLCQGEFCAFQPRSASPRPAVNFTVYSMTSDGVLRLHQSIGIQRSTRVKTFVLPDVAAQGNWVDTQFMAVSYRGSPSSGNGGVGVWYWSRGQFEQRQVLPAVEANAVDFISHKGMNLIAYTDNGPTSRVMVYNWVEGSFRIVSLSSAVSRMQWVDGKFEQPVAQIDVFFAMDCKLYNSSESALHLAILDRSSSVTSSAEVKVFTYNQEACQNSSCFLPHITIHSFGAYSITPLKFGSYDLLAVATHFQGMYDYQQSEQYDCKSYIYRMDYMSNTYSLLQVNR